VQLPSGRIVTVRNPSATSFSDNAFAMTVGGGADIKINRKFALRLVQAEYLYTRFGNNCNLAICFNNNNQNSFRLKSGIVISWGGERPAKIVPPPPPPPVVMKDCPGAPQVQADQECPRRPLSVSVQATPNAVCVGATSQVTATGLPEGAATQWTVNGEAIGQAPTLEFGSTGRNAGSYTVGLKVTAPGYEDASATTAITVLGYVPPSGSLAVATPVIAAGDKVTLTPSFTAGQCGGPLSAVAYSASEGSVSGNQFDSSSVRFDPAGTSEQRKTVTVTARVTDQGGAGTAQASLVVTQKAAIAAKRYPDIVFPANSARVNNCGKRVLLEDLKSSLDSDPNGMVVFVGHTSQKETASPDLDLRRAMNAAAVISAGAQICLGFSAANILVTGAGPSSNGVDFQPYFCESSTGEISGNLVKQTEDEAKNRRVEVWFVPPGGVAPASAQGSKDALGLNVKTLGCPR
jgi:outer membrane protein OmpA-like peptidoglycan-associated protein